MIGSWAQQNLTIPTIAREVFPLIANKGGPSNPYTIGIGGNLNTARPPNQSSISGVGLLLNTSSPVVEIPRAMLTDDAWEAVQVKELGNPLFTDLYYNPTYTSNLGTINLWPVPDGSQNTSLVLYLQKALTAFADLTTEYDFPPAYEEAMVYNLCRRIAKPWGATLDADVLNMASTSLSLIKRSNVKLTDLPTDPALTANNRFSYNIQTGLGG